MYANAITSKRSPYLREYIMEIIYQYMQNCIYDDAAKNVMDAALRDHSFSDRCDGRERKECLKILEVFRNILREEGQMK